MGFFYFGKKKKNHGKVDNCMELLISLSVRICASPPGHSYHLTMINHGLLGNSKSFVRPKRMLKEVGIQYCITRSETD